MMPRKCFGGRSLALICDLLSYVLLDAFALGVTAKADQGHDVAYFESDPMKLRLLMV